MQKNIYYIYHLFERSKLKNLIQYSNLTCRIQIYLKFNVTYVLILRNVDYEITDQC
jgi:hypothetical protein